MVVTDRTAPGDAPEVAGRALTPAAADLTAVAVAGEVRQRTPPATWYAALGVAWAAFVATGVLLPTAAGLAPARRSRGGTRRHRAVAGPREAGCGDSCLLASAPAQRGPPSSGIATILATIVVGGAVGAATIVAVVNSQTGAPSESPASVEAPVIDYGS